MSDQYQVATLDAFAFREWLEKRRDQVVGCSASEESCPLARFLSETCGVPYVVGGSRYYVAEKVSAWKSLPTWALTFIYGLDFTYVGDEVYGLQALDFLPHAVLSQSDGIGEQYCWMHTPGGWTCAECRLLYRLQVQAQAVAWYAFEKGFSVVQTVRTHRFLLVGTFLDVSVQPFASHYDYLQQMISMFNDGCPFPAGDPDEELLVTSLL